jgi:hypothetical protein
MDRRTAFFTEFADLLEKHGVSLIVRERLYAQELVADGIDIDFDYRAEDYPQQGANLGMSIDADDLRHEVTSNKQNNMTDNHFQILGCDSCPYAQWRFNSGAGATTCDKLHNRIVSYGSVKSPTRPDICPLPSSCDHKWVYLGGHNEYYVCTKCNKHERK